MSNGFIFLILVTVIPVEHHYDIVGEIKNGRATEDNMPLV
jgi:hypothetical protein